MILNILLLAIAVGAIIMAFIAWQRVADLKTERAQLETKLEIMEREAPDRQRASEDRFKIIAREILDSNSAELSRRQELRLETMLNPLKQDIDEFRRSVTACYDAEARERFSLKERIRELIELNRSIGREAKDLTVALRGSGKVQGDWGEMVLETILEKSGLQKGVEFMVQETAGASGATLKDDDGKLLRPDVVVYYPDGRCIVIDSKVSLTAFMQLSNADTEEDEKHWGQRHLSSVKSHIAELRRKNYQDFTGDRKTDFVMMFIPNEPAYIAAMRLDPNLWQEAYDSRVLIVSPTHLIAALRLVSQLWRQDRQNRNAAEIAEVAGRMLDKFVGFTDDMAKVKKSLDMAADAHAAAMKKLSEGSGNLVARARRLRDLGAKSTKTLPGSDSVVDNQDCGELGQS